MVVDWVEADANFEAKFNKKAGFKQTNHLDLKHCVLCKNTTNIFSSFAFYMYCR